MREMVVKKTKMQKIMHEWKMGTLHSGKDPDGKGPKKAPLVKSQKQAVAIALRQAGVVKKKTAKMACGGMVKRGK